MSNGISRCVAMLVGACLCWQASSAEPPSRENELRFVIVSSAGTHGSAELQYLPGGNIASRVKLELRGMRTELEETLHLGPGNLPDRLVIRGTTPRGEASETFHISNGVATWETPIDRGSTRYDGKSLYLPIASTWSDAAYWTEALFRAPDRRLALLPAGHVQMRKLVDIQVGTGSSTRPVTAWLIEGLALEPSIVLLTPDGTFFGAVGGNFAGTAGGLALLPQAYVADLGRIERAQEQALAARQKSIRSSLGEMPTMPIAFTHVRLFDAEAALFLDDQTVIANDGRIAAVGPSGSVDVPAHARIISGRGKTLLPGIWDAHMHVASDRQGLMLLSLGETSARNPGANAQATLLRSARIARGELMFPTVYSSVIVDGNGPFAAQGALTVSSVSEAVGAVRKIRSEGYTGVKFYGSIKPEYLRASIVEAHRLGLHVHGHIPAGMRPTDVIEAGYDEITHINFLIMQAMPSRIVDVDNGIARIEGPGAFAKDVDLAAEPMRSLIAEMAAKKVAIDPTLTALEKVYVPEDGEMQPAFVPFVGTLPPMMERGFRMGGFRPPAGSTRSDLRASFAKMLELTGLLYRAGVPLVAGTDGNGLEIVRELELYVQAGLTPAEALQCATIAPARLVGADLHTGSIRVGKQADLVLVDGDPSQRIGDMRRTLWVMSDGVLMNANELRQIAGFSTRAHH